jgi:hypothetical protein
MTRRTSRILDLPEEFHVRVDCPKYSILAEYQSALCEKFPAVNSFCWNHAEPKSPSASSMGCEILLSGSLHSHDSKRWMICLARCFERMKTSMKDEIDGMIRNGRVNLNASRYDTGVDAS